MYSRRLYVVHTSGIAEDYMQYLLYSCTVVHTYKTKSKNLNAKTTVIVRKVFMLRISPHILHLM
jgi:hypothetical protein